MFFFQTDGNLNVPCDLRYLSVFTFDQKRNWFAHAHIKCPFTVHENNKSRRAHLCIVVMSEF